MNIIKQINIDRNSILVIDPSKSVDKKSVDSQSSTPKRKPFNRDEGGATPPLRVK